MPLDLLPLALLLALALRWFVRKAWRYHQGEKHFRHNMWRVGIREVR